MTLGSLFSGIGGLDLGLERAGFTVKWQVEIDPYCRTILERHWPGVHRRSDVRLCDATTLAPVDCIAGGFPCQDISGAGKGAGITGRRSGLWSEYARLVRELRPRWVLVENVPALRTRGADAVLGDLEAAGYTCEALVVGARHVGAPHRRDRVWIVAQLADGQGERRQTEGSGGIGSLQGAGATGGVGHADDAGSQGRSVRRCECADERAVGPAGDATARMAHGHGHGCEGERCGGLLDGEWAAQRNDVDRRDSRMADARGDDLRQQPGRRCGTCGADSSWPAGVGPHQHEWEAPRATEPRVGRATHGVSRRLALKALGNSVVPQVVEALGRAMVAIA